jgi:hypothetical protein
MAPLATGQVARLLQTCRELYHERAELEELLAQLLPAWGDCRDTLNEISRPLG